MTPEVRRELEGLVEELRALVPRLRRRGQPLATQLLEMAVLEIKSRMYGIADEEFQALVDALSSQSGTHDNRSVLSRILELRRAKSELLGFHNFASELYIIKNFTTWLQTRFMQEQEVKFRC